MRILYPICDSNQQNKFGNTPIMEAALALEMTDSEFIEIIKLALEHETNFRTVFCMVGKISVAAILTAVRFVEF